MRGSHRDGQALLESLPVIITLFPLLFSLLWAIGVFFSHYWLDYWSYEAAICLSSERALSQCKSDLDTKIKRGDFFTKTQVMRFYRTQNFVEVKLISQTRFKNKFLTKYIFHRIELPLIPRDQL